MIYQIVRQLQQEAIPVLQSCHALDVSRSGYYEAQRRCTKPKVCKASVHLKAAFLASHQSYGSRRLVTALSDAGFKIGRYKVRSLMQQAALKPVWKRKFINTTDSKHDLPIAANVLNRRFNPTAPNLAYVTDITYIRTAAGWLYLAIVLDLYARKVVGWGNGAEHACQACLRCTDHGDSAAATRARSDCPLGSGESICQRDVLRYAGAERLRLQHEPQGKLRG